MKTLLTAATALVCCTAMPVWAAALQPDITILNDDIIYDVNQDGTFTMDEVETFRLNTDQGVKQHSQISLPYSASLEAMDVSDAYTMSKDGKRTDVAPDKILIQQSPQSAGAPMFDDGKVKVVVFPAVEVGSTISLHIHKTQKTALFPKQFSMLEFAWANQEIKSERVTVKAPASLQLYVDAVDMAGGRVKSDIAGQQVWQWAIANTVAHSPETAGVAVGDYSPRVAVTTFASYEAAAQAYLERAEPKAAVTPGIQKLADEITANVTDRRAQAEALYRWVSQNIRYVAIFLDFGGVVPHDAQSIADARYGDCKDHATLLEALIAAKGIHGYPVLINGDASYSLPKVAVTPGVFNHAITYLPEFKLFVDSTAGLAMFGALPVTEYGKQALVTNDGSGQPRILKLPLATAENDRVEIKTHLVVDNDGSVTGFSDITNTGTFDWLTRQILAGVPQGMEPKVVSKVLAMSGQSGTGSYKPIGLHDLTKPFSYSTSFKLPNFVQLPGPGAMAIPNGFTSFSNIASAIEMFGPEQRESAFAVVSHQVSESISIQLPTGMTVSTLPRAANLNSPLGQYKSTYQVNGSVLTVTRTLTIATPDVIGSPQDYQVLRTMALGINRDLRAQIVFN